MFSLDGLSGPANAPLRVTLRYGMVIRGSLATDKTFVKRTEPLNEVDVTTEMSATITVTAASRRAAPRRVGRTTNTARSTFVGISVREAEERRGQPEWHRAKHAHFAEHDQISIECPD